MKKGQPPATSESGDEMAFRISSERFMPNANQVCITVLHSQQNLWDDALSDVLCWLNRFVAGGGYYSPETQNHLRDLRDTVRRGYDTNAVHGKAALVCVEAGHPKIILVREKSGAIIGANLEIDDGINRVAMPIKAAQIVEMPSR